MKNLLTNFISLSTLILFYLLSGKVSGEKLSNQVEMVSERIRLSYVDPVRCAQLLNFYGVTIGDSNKPIDPKQHFSPS